MGKKTAEYKLSPDECWHLEKILSDFVDALDAKNTQGEAKLILSAAESICSESGVSDESKKENVRLVRK